MDTTKLKSILIIIEYHLNICHILRFWSIKNTFKISNSMHMVHRFAKSFFNRHFAENFPLLLYLII